MNTCNRLKIIWFYTYRESISKKHFNSLYFEIIIKSTQQRESRIVPRKTKETKDNKTKTNQWGARIGCLTPFFSNFFLSIHILPQQSIFHSFLVAQFVLPHFIQRLTDIKESCCTDHFCFQISVDYVHNSINLLDWRVIISKSNWWFDMSSFSSTWFYSLKIELFKNFLHHW